MIIVTGYIYVPPTKLTPFMTDFAALASVTRQRNGNISYDTAVLNAQSGKLLVTERWADQAALSDHLNASETEGFISKWRDQMQGDIHKYDVLNERDLLEN